VHRARLKQAQSANVVVKVQRPNIEQVIATDLAALRRAGWWISRYPPIRKRVNVPSLINEFERILREEIDYEAEGRNAGIFADNFKDDPSVIVPLVIWPLTTRRVLTLEDVQAIKITNYDEITAAGIDRPEVASHLLDTYLQQMFEDGFFHADPHPGNLFVTPVSPPQVVDAETGGTLDWKLIFVDFGMVGRLSPQMKQGLRELLVAVGTRDTAAMIHAYETMGVLLPGADLELLKQAEAEAFDRFWGKSMDELTQVSMQEIGEFALRFRQLIYDLPFQVPQDLILIGRTVGILSGMCTGLDPQFNVWEEILPYAQKFVMEDSPSGIWRETLGRGLRRALELPARLENLLARVERGDLATRHPETQRSMQRVERAVLRLVGAVIFAGLLLAGIQLFLAGYVFPAWGLWAAAVLALGWVFFGVRYNNR
jgi:predicted unusual protein kinase regulating ubiquinone biosynthesis (AarF/ABC1/UbiB family)